ncbi:phospholipase [Sphingomonas piscis]|uniref:Phospholipase D n=1 Tax=Sphingomonas piscis TaxID=2714943 RepID=A0A6G7YMB2_9SPHN|nr:phospholipase D-like domain-containing protein [Sphingomonas piscis]QIK77867.1 phospholipase [Sphingomonas piscis]
MTRRVKSSPLLHPGRNCWRVERAERAALVVDAADYFHHVRKAMLQAKKQILLIGWDFDTRIELDDADDEAPATLGSFISFLAKCRPDLCIYVLRWDLGATKLLARGTTVFRLINWVRTKGITFKLDAAHPTGASHHQKIVVIDDNLAFCGGIDMTATRWDTRAHRDDDEGRKRPTTGRRYGPWHDATMAVDGAAAKALGDLARERWARAGGKPIEPPTAEGDSWPPELEPQFQKVDVAVARTRGEFKQFPEVREIEALYLDMIAAAKRYVYFENQYFASRVVAEAIGKRLKEKDGPEFVVVNPNKVEGFMEDEVMRPARTKVTRTLQDLDRHDRFRIYTPVTEGGEDIYVHSKIGIVDDRMIRVGSANINNRSMGLDSECDLLIDADGNAGKGISPQIHAILCDLLGEHLGKEASAIEALLNDGGSLIACVERMRGKGRTLRPLEMKELSALEAEIAETEMLDPEKAGEYFDTAKKPGLLGRLKRLRHPFA